jgi:hypothetical protein
MASNQLSSNKSDSVSGKELSEILSKEVIEQGLKTEKFVMNFVTISSAVDRFHGNGK